MCFGLDKYGFGVALSQVLMIFFVVLAQVETFLAIPITRLEVLMMRLENVGYVRTRFPT